LQQRRRHIRLVLEHVEAGAGIPPSSSSARISPQAGAGALVVIGSAFFTSKIRTLVALSARHAIPTIYDIRDYVREITGPAVSHQFARLLSPKGAAPQRRVGGSRRNAYRALR
jgi:hypothetical protein